MINVLVCLLLLAGCHKSAPDPAPDPLTNAAGTYKGTLKDNTTVRSDAQAIVATKIVDGRIQVSGITVSATNVFVTLTLNTNNRYETYANGLAYSTDFKLEGNVLTLNGSTTGSPGGGISLQDFIFVGTKQ